MWQPPERIKHELAPAAWPAEAEAAAARLFQPCELGPRRAETRTWVPAMVPWRATEDGFVTRDVIDWYRRFAEGKPGVLVVEATGIRDIPSGPLLRIGHDRFLPGLSRLVETVRRASQGRTRLLIQLIDFLAVRRRPEPQKFFERFLAITAAHRAALGAPDLPEAEIRARLSAMSAEELARVLAPDEWEALQFGYRERVTDMHRPHIRDLPQVLPGLRSALPELVLPVRPGSLPDQMAPQVTEKKMRNTDQLRIRAVFPTGPHGDLCSDHARELEQLLARARRHTLDFRRDGSRPQLHVTMWFAQQQSRVRASHPHHRYAPPQTVAA